MSLPGIALYIKVNITSSLDIGTNMNIFILRKVPKKQTWLCVMPTLHGKFAIYQLTMHWLY